MLEKNLSAALDRTVGIARIEIKPLARSATLRDVSIADRGQGPTIARWRDRGHRALP